MEYVDYNKLFETYQSLLSFDKERFLKLCQKDIQESKNNQLSQNIDLDDVFFQYNTDDVMDYMDSDDIADYSLRDTYIRNKILWCSGKMEYYIALKNNPKLQSMLKEILKDIDKETHNINNG